MAAYLTEHFPSIAVTLLRAAAWLVILSAIFVPLERLFALHPQKIFRKEVAVDLGYYFLNAVVVALVLGPPVAIIAFVMRHVVPGSVVGTLSALPIWARVCAAMVVGETGYYGGIAGPTRSRFFGVSTPCTTAPNILAGLVWGYFVHANLRWRLGPLEWIVATPGFHHWHHTYGLQRNCNYASILPWIDRLFGSRYLPKVWPSRYGIPEPIAATLAGQLVQPFQERRAAAAAANVTERTRRDATLVR